MPAEDLKKDQNQFIVSEDLKEASHRLDDATIQFDPASKIELNQVELVNLLDDFIGKTIKDHYTITSVLGSGGLGVVFKGRDILLAKDVALKFLWPDRSTDSKSLERFEREAKTAVGLKRCDMGGSRDL